MMTTNNEERASLYDGVPNKVVPPKPFKGEEAVPLTRADLIKRVVPWLNELADNPDDISREKTAIEILDLFFKSLFAQGTRDTFGYRQVLIFSIEGLKEAGFPVSPHYLVCRTCGHSGPDVIETYGHIGGKGNPQLVAHCIDLDACDARQMLKVIKGRESTLTNTA